MKTVDIDENMVALRDCKMCRAQMSHLLSNA